MTVRRTTQDIKLIILLEGTKWTSAELVTTFEELLFELGFGNGDLNLEKY